MKVLYLDESGESNPAVVDTHYPVFVLGGVIMDQRYAAGPLIDAVNSFKRELFGTVDIVLHTSDINRNRNGFEGLLDDAFRRRFYDRINALMADLQYQVIACAVRKDRAIDGRFGNRDLYRVCFGPLVELFCAELGNAQDEGIIIAEKRSSTRLNRAVEIDFVNLKTDGGRHTDPGTIANRILAFNLRDKQDNIAGLQLADLALSPLGRHLIGKRDHPDWRIIAAKLLRSGVAENESEGLILLQ